MRVQTAHNHLFWLSTLNKCPDLALLALHSLTRNTHYDLDTACKMPWNSWLYFIFFSFSTLQGNIFPYYKISFFIVHDTIRYDITTFFHKKNLQDSQNCIKPLQKLQSLDVSLNINYQKWHWYVPALFTKNWKIYIEYVTTNTYQNMGHILVPMTDKNLTSYTKRDYSIT